VGDCWLGAGGRDCAMHWPYSQLCAMSECVSVDLPRLGIDYFCRGKHFATLSSNTAPPHTEFAVCYDSSPIRAYCKSAVFRIVTFVILILAHPVYKM